MRWPARPDARRLPGTLDPGIARARLLDLARRRSGPQLKPRPANLDAPPGVQWAAIGSSVQ